MSDKERILDNRDGFRKRLQLDFTPEEHARLMKLKVETGLQTTTGVIRRAISRLSRETAYCQSGWKLILRSPSGDELELKPDDYEF